VIIFLESDLNGDIAIQPRDPSGTFYLTIYNYGANSANLDLQVADQSRGFLPKIFDPPTPCGVNAACSKNLCFCNSGYSGNPYENCELNTC